MFGGPSLDLMAAELQSREESSLHIAILEMKATVLPLATFLPQMSGQSVVLMSGNATVVAYLRNQGGTVTHVLCCMVLDIVLWTEHHSVSLSAQYIPGKKNVL